MQGRVSLVDARVDGLVIEFRAIVDIERLSVANVQELDDFRSGEHHRTAQLDLRAAIRVERIVAELLANVDGALDEGDELPGSFRERGARMLKGEAFAIAVELSLATQRTGTGGYP